METKKLENYLCVLHSEIMYEITGSIPFHLNENQQLSSASECLKVFIEFNKLRVKLLSEQLSEHYKCKPSEVLDRIQLDFKYLIGKKYENTDDEEDF